ncbi:MAG: NUDIX hydrolase [Marinifilaceae bacterium]
MEILDIVNLEGIPTGEVVDRATAHKEGILHRTAHVWLIRNNNSTIEVLLQERATLKQLFPNCFDVSSAGHIPAGEDYIPSALRELQEELGITATSEQLMDCGIRHIDIRVDTTHSVYIDKQVSRVFYMWYNGNINNLSLQQEEVKSICWMPLEECIDGVKRNTFKNCIALDELYMIKNAIENKR